MSKWTTDRPTANGWYWYATVTSCVQPCFVDVGSGCVTFPFGNRSRRLLGLSGEWIGPMAEPRHPCEKDVDAPDGV